VVVDDFLPVGPDNQLIFSKNRFFSNELWCALLEKAYAKVNVNYEMISSGAAAEAARFLTGAPARDFQTNYQTHDELWNSLSINLK